MPTVDLPGIRSISTDSAFSASDRSSARPVTFAYFTPASGLNSKVVTTGPGVDLDDRPGHRELVALLLEQAGGVHQLALVDLVLALRRVEQRQRRQGEAVLLPLDRHLRFELGDRGRPRRGAGVGPAFLTRHGARARDCGRRALRLAAGASLPLRGARDRYGAPRQRAPSRGGRALRAAWPAQGLHVVAGSAPCACGSPPAAASPSAWPRASRGPRPRPPAPRAR